MHVTSCGNTVCSVSMRSFERSLLVPRDLKCLASPVRKERKMHPFAVTMQKNTRLRTGSKRDSLICKRSTKKSKLSEDEKFLKKFLEELDEQHKNQKAKGRRDLVEEHTVKKRVPAAERRSAGPQLASHDSYKRKQDHLRISSALTIVLF